MKIVWFCILLLASSPAISQERNYKLTDSVFKKFLADTVFYFNQVNNQSSSKSWTRIGTTTYGVVYALPLDNMPCIVPGENPSQRMPNYGLNLGYMDPGIYKDRFRKMLTQPNDSYKLKLIPKKKSSPLNRK
jgi:hypothetical protein